MLVAAVSMRPFLLSALDEAGIAALRRKTPEAQDFLLAERESVLRRHLPEAHDAGSAHPWNGHAKALKSI